MKKIIITISLCLSIVVIYSQTPCANDSNIYEFTFSGKKYEVVMEKKTWAIAADGAVERGGYLAAINSLEEQNAVYDAVINGAKVPPTYVSIANGGGIAYVWIGANDIATEGTWVWEDADSGTHFWTGQGAAGTGGGAAFGNAYVNWGGKSTATIKEPDNFNDDQNCGAMAMAGWPSGTTVLGSASEWNDIICSSEIYFVIEFEPSGSEEIQHDQEIRIYPNPANDIIHINGDYNFVEIMDIAGKVFIKSDFSKKIDISSLSTGVYLVKILKGNHVLTKKIIINDL